MTLATFRTLAEICDTEEVVTVLMGQKRSRSGFTIIDMNDKLSGKIRENAKRGVQCVMVSLVLQLYRARDSNGSHFPLLHLLW